jgi:hypothetical protein
MNTPQRGHDLEPPSIESCHVGMFGGSDNRTVAQKWFASRDELSLGGLVTIYEPVSDVVGNVDGVRLRRDGYAPFTCPETEVKCKKSGLRFVLATATPHGGAIYEYWLLRQIGILDCVTGKIEDAPWPALVGMPGWDLREIDCNPGLYYVTAQDDCDRPVFLLGPFARHLDAITRIAQTIKGAQALNGEGIWFKYGTVRWNGSAEECPTARLNDEALSCEEQKLLARSDGLDSTSDSPSP